MTMLIAACDIALASIMGRKFGRDGWDVEIAESVREAEHKAVRMRPLVLLLDARCVPNVAAEVRRLKALPTLVRTKIVLLAETADRAHIEAALAAGAADYLLAGHFVPLEAVEKMRRLVAV